MTTQNEHICTNIVRFKGIAPNAVQENMCSSTLANPPTRHSLEDTMTTDNPRYSDTERAALERRLRSALADAGLSGTLSPGSVRITEEGVSLNMSMNEASWFTNQISDLAEGSTNPVISSAHTKDKTQTELALLFEEVHTIPTGYKPAKVQVKVAA